MLDAAQSIRRITAGLSHDDYQRNEIVQLAVERQLEVIGEAARRVSDEFKRAHPEIPWQPIIGQRNVIAHEYGEISHVRIWRVVVQDLPGLIAALEPLVPPTAPDQSSLGK